MQAPSKKKRQNKKKEIRRKDSDVRTIVAQVRKNREVEECTRGLIGTLQSWI